MTTLPSACSPVPADFTVGVSVLAGRGVRFVNFQIFLTSKLVHCE